MIRFFKKTCPICSQEAKDLLTRGGKKGTWYCRQHLVEEFKKEFLASSSRMLVCEPDFKNVCDALYGCYSLKRMQKFDFEKPLVEKAREIISRLDSGLKCTQCKGSAQAIYFDSSYLPILYQSTGIFKPLGPFLEKLPSDKGIPFCLNCVFQRIRPLIQTNQGDFNDGGGLHTPYGERCVFVSTYL